MEEEIFGAWRAFSVDIMPRSSTSRQLTSTNAQSAAITAKWKSALWEKNSIEPAMLRVPIVLIVFIILWGANVWTLERLRLQYHSAISVKSVSLSFVFLHSAFLAIAYGIVITVNSSFLGAAVESGVFIFYSFLLVALATPWLPGRETRSSFFKLVRIVFMPGNAITFPEVLLADALTSLSKVFKDFGVTIVAIYAQVSEAPIVGFHEEGMILIALLASLPFWIRVRQCWVQFVAAPDNWAKLPISLNIMKYVSAFPPIWLAAAASLGFFHPDLPAITAAMATINSLYSYSWDICMDWGLITFTRTGRVLFRQRMMLPWFVYLLAAVINLILRFSWAANRVPQLAALHSSHLLLMMEIGEVCRRSMWNIIRIEWEVIVQNERAASNKTYSKDETDLDLEDSQEKKSKSPKVVSS